MSKLQLVVQTLKPIFEQWLFEVDMPESLVPVVKEFLDFTKGCVPLLLTDPFEQWQHAEALEHIKSYFNAMGQSLEFVIERAQRGRVLQAEAQ